LKRLLLVAIAVALVLPSAARTEVPALSYVCQPAPQNCGTWYRTAVSLVWEWDNTAAKPISGNCNDQTFTADTAGTLVSCEVEDRFVPGDSAQRTATIRIDRTAPTITGPGLARPPDFGAWFNHPVGFTFTGADATSGIASCTGGTYGGPDGAGVTLSGTCTDVAGNLASGAFAINYDATPPPSANVSALPGNRRVRLSWDSAQNLAGVVRISKGSSKGIYLGGGEKFTDRGFRNGRRYRYVVTLIDQAGNRSTDTTSAVPTSSKLLLPANGARVTGPPELVWKRIKRAAYYNAQLRFRGRKVLTRWPVRPRLQLTQRWRSLGRRHHLARGRYCWYVWPGYGARRLHNYGQLMGVSCFRVVG
jgi:hypothetical protein